MILSIALIVYFKHRKKLLHSTRKKGNYRVKQRANIESKTYYTLMEDDLMIDFKITYKRSKGPSTPKFRKMAIMLDKMPTKIPIDRKKVIREHGAVGIKMLFVCDIIEKLQLLSNETKAWHNEKGIVYTKKREFYDFLFNLDVFIFELYSILDYFALEVGHILKLQKKKKRRMVNIEYFTDLKRAQGFSQNTLAIKGKAQDLEDQPWFEYFHDMRNRIVHRLPVSLGGLIPLPLQGKYIDFPFLPDKPKNQKTTYTQKLVPLANCKKWLQGIFSFADDVCSDLGRELFRNF